MINNHIRTLSETLFKKGLWVINTKCVSNCKRVIIQSQQVYLIVFYVTESDLIYMA